jgi:hypothetical protein
MDRLLLQSLLEEVLGSSNVYFQPPANIKLSYPCIVYKRSGSDTIFADNVPYRRTTRYQVTVIDRNPDSNIPKKVGDLESCTHNDNFAVDNLNHDVFTLYY